MSNYSAEIEAAAVQYLDGFDSLDPIEAIAERGTSEADDEALEAEHGDDWSTIALCVQERAAERIAAD